MTNDASLGSSSNYYAPYVHGFGCDLTTSWRRSLFVLIALLASPSNSFAAIPIVQEWYVPQPEDQIRADYLVLAPNTNTTTDSVIDLAMRRTFEIPVTIPKTQCAVANNMDLFTTCFFGGRRGETRTISDLRSDGGTLSFAPGDLGPTRIAFGEQVGIDTPEIRLPTERCPLFPSKGWKQALSR